MRPQDLLAFISSKRYGAHVLFLGVIRDHHNRRAVRSVTYDSFRPLAAKILEAILRRACRRWPVQVAASHRLGRLPVGAISLAVAVGAPHRADAFAACRYVVDAIKLRVPIWKKERYSDGQECWLAGHALRPGRPTI